MPLPFLTALANFSLLASANAVCSRSADSRRATSSDASGVGSAAFPVPSAFDCAARAA